MNMMTTLDIRQAILEAVQDIYHKKYVGRIEVDKLQNGYTLRMWFNKPESPITISADLNATDFIKFIRKELRERHFDLVTYFTGYKYEPEDLCNQNINNSCSCNDK
jgi:hypothetical protein